MMTNKKQSKAIDVEALIHLGVEGKLASKNDGIDDVGTKRGDYRWGSPRHIKIL
jgi:hypothetical protein